MFLRSRLNKEAMNKIADIIIEGENEKVEIDYNIAQLSAYFSTESKSNAFCLRKDYKRYTITNVEFKNKRQGTLTKILEILKELAKQENLEIVIESVSTDEMYMFCCKNNFEKVDDIVAELLPMSILGNYALRCY